MRYRSRGHRPRANTNQGFGNTRRPGLRQSFRPNAQSPGSAKPGLSPVGGPKPGLGTAGAAPKPTSKPVAQHASPDSIYYNQVDLANRKQEAALGQLEGQRTSIRHDFGIEDPTNPFSRAEGLKKIFLARQKAASAGLAAAGHLYSGQHERALARTRMDEEQARAELRSAYEQAINQVGAQEAGVKFDTEEQKNQAFEDWLARAPESVGSVSTPPAPPTAAPAIPAKPAAAPITTPKGTGTVSQAAAVAPPPATPAAKNAPVAKPGSKIPTPGPVTRPDRPKTNVEKQLRQKLREARRKGQTKRVVRIRKQIRSLHQGANYRRG